MNRKLLLGLMCSTSALWVISQELCHKGSDKEVAFVLNKQMIDSFHVYAAADILKFNRL